MKYLEIQPVELKVPMDFVGPLFREGVSAGFPSPAEDFMESRLDLNSHLIQHPAATYFVRVVGDSMVGAGIYPSDILIVDKAIEAKNGQVVIAQVNGDFLVKRLSKSKTSIVLVADNPAYPNIDVTNNPDFFVWGVVTNCIHKL